MSAAQGLRGLVVLLTDFGLTDPYVGQMKGALARVSPDLSVIDLSHEIAPYNIVQGAYFLAASWRHFPEGSVFLGIVDPGVGTPRQAVAVRAEKRWFVGPDNGLLTLVLAHDPPDTEAYLITAKAQGSSQTFHGRDVFAPVAARLAQGEPPETLAERIRPEGLLRAQWSAPRDAPGGIVAHVLHADRFGNCTLNLDIDTWWPKLRGLPGLALAHPRREPLTACETYGALPGGGVGLLPGSQGFLELAVNRGSARARLALSPGSLVRIARTGPQDLPPAPKIPGDIA